MVGAKLLGETLGNVKSRGRGETDGARPKETELGQRERVSPISSAFNVMMVVGVPLPAKA